MSFLPITNYMNGVQGFQISSYSSALAAADVNGDGIIDLITGASSNSPGGVANAGSTFVLFGQPRGYPWGSSQNLNNLK
jgi:FG-GAP repeat